MIAIVSGRTTIGDGRVVIVDDDWGYWVRPSEKSLLEVDHLTGTVPKGKKEDSDSNRKLVRAKLIYDCP